MTSERKYRFSESEFFQIPIDRLFPEKSRSFPLFIYISANSHLILRYSPESEITQAQLIHYQKSHLKAFWAPNQYKPVWQKYLESHPAQLKEAAATAKPQNRAEKLAIATLTSGDLEQEEKMEILSRISIDLFSTIAEIEGKDKDRAEKAFRRCKSFAEDVIQVAARSHAMGTLFEDMEVIREMAMLHAAAVSTLTVLIALAMGYVEQELLTDLYLGGLLHDIGLSSIDDEVLSSNLDTLTPGQKILFRGHVKQTLQILTQNDIPCTPNVIDIIEQHHERFDGRGYPKSLRSFQVSELSQIVAYADTLDECMTGKRDGVVRTLMEALTLMDQHQSEGEAPFDPELHSTILQMIRASKVRADQRKKRMIELSQKEIKKALK